MAEIDIGQGKSGRRGFALGDITIVPSRRTRDIADVDVGWKLDAYRFDVPLIGAGVERVVTAADAIAIGQRGGLGMVDLEALWVEVHDGDALSEKIAAIGDAGVRVAASVSPGHAIDLVPHAVRAEVDIIAIQGPIVSADRVSSSDSTVDLKAFIRSLDTPVIAGGCASYAGALHLMRTGAAGVIVGVDRRDLGVGVPLASAIADARAARVRHLDETGVYCHLIARGPISTGADVARAVACGADAVIVDSSVILTADAQQGDVVGSLREAMATCGYTSLKDFQKVEVVVR